MKRSTARGKQRHLSGCRTGVHRNGQNSLATAGATRHTKSVLRAFARFALPVAFALGATTAGAQPRVRVLAESRIELRTERLGDRVRVHGVLRDDLGDEIADQPIHVVAVGETTTIRQSRELRTNAQGGFSLELDSGTGDDPESVAESRYRLSAVFEGDDFHYRVEVSRTVDLAREEVRLSVLPRSGGHLDLEVASHTIEITAESDAGAAGIEIETTDELGRLLARGTTDEHGQLEQVIASTELGPPGAGRLRVRSREDNARAEALIEVPVVRFRQTAITLRARATEIAPEEPFGLDGELTEGGRPVSLSPVGIFDGDAHLGTVLTREDGSFSFEGVLEGADRTAEIVARYDSDSPGRTSAVSEPVRMRVGAQAAALWPWLLVPIALSAALFFWLTRRGRKKAPRASVVPGVPRPGIVPAVKVSRRPQHAGFAARIVDAGDGAPLTGARIAFALANGDTLDRLSDAEGRVAIDELPEGRTTLEASIEGYETVRAVFEVPHRGEWSDAIVRLESLRARALASFRSVAIDLLPSPELWETRTNREIVDRHAAAPVDGDPVNELERRVEAAYYAPAPPSPVEVQEIEGARDRALDRLGRRPGEKPAPSRGGQTPPRN
jgi:hypothetical protein